MISSTHDTLGGYAQGNASGINYKVEAALQKDATLKTNSTDATAKADATYISAEIGKKVGPVMLKGQYESLGAKSATDAGFTTPWATLHKFNGFTDQFLGGTPAGGLSDKIITAVYKNEKLGKFVGAFHKFDSAQASTNLGSELDLIWAKKIAGVAVLAKAGIYTKGDVGTDTKKIWLQAAYTFKN
jgi:hypothetical protein